MEPLLPSNEAAKELLEEVRKLSEPFALGDLPYEHFTLEEILEAHTKAGMIVVHLTEYVENEPRTIEYYVHDTLSKAHQAFRTLHNVLVKRSDLDRHTQLDVLLGERARVAMWKVYDNIKVEYIRDGKAVEMVHLPL
jgi:hypothetical protein